MKSSLTRQPAQGLTSLFMLSGLQVLRTTPKPVKVFQLPDFPVSLSTHTVQSYYSELILQLGKTIFSIQNENPAMLARCSLSLLMTSSPFSSSALDLNSCL